MADGIPDESVTLTLKRPLVLKESTITELVIKEPTAGQMAFAEQGAKTSTDQGIILLGLACNLSPMVIKQLAGSDYLKAQKVLGNFFETSPENGEK